MAGRPLATGVAMPATSRAGLGMQQAGWVQLGTPTAAAAVEDAQPSQAAAAAVDA
jgi:hypothetical protein